MEKHHDSLVILIHGFCRSGADMLVWKKHLESTFPNIITPDLPAKYADFEQCVEKLTQDIEAAHPGNFRHIHIAGHSMGGLMAREYLCRNPLENVRHLVCAGTPHYGSKLADIALRFPGAGAVWKPLHALKCSARTQISTPPIPELKIGVIVSKNNSLLPGKLFFRGESDGLVECFSALAPDAEHAVFTPVNHVKMQYDPFTAELIQKFFSGGRFE